MGRYVIGVDLGTGGPKVALAAVDGTILGHEYERTPVEVLPGGGAEQNPDTWWSAIRTALKRLLDRGLAPVADIEAICMSSQWGGIVPVDAAGRHLHNAVIWMDARGARYSEKLVGGGLEVPGTGYNARRLRAWLAKTGGVPSQTGKDPVGQIQFLKNERPDVYAAAAKMLDVPEYLTMRLTGRAVAGWDTAVLRWCTDNRDPGRVRWDDALIALSGLDRRHLPELVRPGSVVGTILPGVADELGLPATTRVVAGTGDTAAAAVGAGAVADYQAHLYIGTSAWLSGHVPYKKTDIVNNIASMPAVVPDRYWVATIQDVAGKAIDWLLSNVVYPDDELGSGTDEIPHDALDRLNRLAESAPPGSNGVLFTPWLNGERTPVDDRAIRGGWHHVSLTTTRADLVRAVFEGIALNARWMLDAVEKFVGGRQKGGFPAITFIGGGANSRLWCQAMADILDRPIRQAEEPVLANVRGAALIASVAVGALRWDEVPPKVAIRETFLPDPAHRELYDRLYGAYTAIYKRNKAIHRELTGS